MTERILNDAPPASTPGVRKRMSAQRKRDTSCEMRLRRALHRAGYRFRVQLPVPGASRRTIDIAFTRAKVAIFVDGCFWHGCPSHGHSPNTNAEWWNRKISRNRDRDTDTDQLLENAGWHVIRVWEHEDVSTSFTAVESALRTQDARPRSCTAKV